MSSGANTTWIYDATNTSVMSLPFSVTGDNIDTEVTLSVTDGCSLSGAALCVVNPDHVGYVFATVDPSDEYAPVMAVGDGECWIGDRAGGDEIPISVRINFPVDSGCMYEIVALTVVHGDGIQAPNGLFDLEYPELWVDDVQDVVFWEDAT
jgi:hypothetical protein